MISPEDFDYNEYALFKLMKNNFHYHYHYISPEYLLGKNLNFAKIICKFSLKFHIVFRSQVNISKATINEF